MDAREMERHPFIFSDQPTYRIRRHLVFWSFWWLFQGVLYTFAPSPMSIAFLEKLPFSMIDSLLFLFSHIFLSYSLMYFVVPRYLLKNRYLATSIWVIILFIATSVLSSLTAMYAVDSIRSLLIPGWSKIPLWARSYHGTFFMGLLAGLRGGITIAGLAVAIKLMKYWYVKEQHNRQLEKENMESQLQLLKAQVHPHFLFNTLNNIYSHTQNTSPIASQLVMGLSDMLRYMLYEGRMPSVPLSEEIKMIEEYIYLEKIRYGNKLELHIDLPPNSDLAIAPLLLLPFVENCFKHGTSNILEHPWLNLQVSVQGNQMMMKLLNGKPPRKANEERAAGIGIQNVQRRLELIYPGRHELVITDETEVFIVRLKVELEKRPAPQGPASAEQPMTIAGEHAAGNAVGNAAGNGSSLSSPLTITDPSHA